MLKKEHSDFLALAIRCNPRSDHLRLEASFFVYPLSLPTWTSRGFPSRFLHAIAWESATAQI